VHLQNVQEIEVDGKGSNLMHINVIHIVFTALTLLVRQQEGYPVCKKTKWLDAGVVI